MTVPLSTALFDGKLFELFQGVISETFTNVASIACSEERFLTVISDVYSFRVVLVAGSLPSVV